MHNALTGLRGPYLFLTRMVSVGGQRAGAGEEGRKGPGGEYGLGLEEEAGLLMTWKYSEDLVRKGGKLHPPQRAPNQDGMGVETFKMKLNLTNIREEKQSHGLRPPWGSAVPPQGPIPPPFLPETRSS